ncbi:MAG: hypothetical protein WDO17_17925 [Alphaproteobacteria bacterium]
MIRKTILALAGVAALSAAALAPTSASAWGFKGGGWGHHGWGPGFGYGVGFVGAPTYVTLASDCYYVKKITRSGFVKVIKVCE